MEPDFVYEIPARTAVGPFSRNSRLRLLKIVNRIDWSRIIRSQFITLTYPDEVAERTYKKRSQDRYVILRNIEMLNNKHVPSIWRVEWQPRKSGKLVGELMPHFHILVMGAEKIQVAWLRDKWAQALGMKNKYVNVDVRVIKGELGAVKYLAKYVSKRCNLGIDAYHNNSFGLGRHWGVTRKHLIPWAPILMLRRLNASDIDQVKFYAQTIFPTYNPSDCGGFTVFGKDVASLFQTMLE